MPDTSTRNSIASLASSWGRPQEEDNLPGELATEPLNDAAASDSAPDKPVVTQLLKELEHSQALNRQLLKQLTQK